MKLEILSFSEALKYIPKEKSGAIRILDEFGGFIPDLKKSENWIGINNYYFDDLWPPTWKEYSWVGDSDWNKLLEIERKNSSNMTRESLISYFESRGNPYGRHTLFDKNFARKILSDFENIRDRVGNIVIHCTYGRNRSPAIGKAMNEIYSWGIKNLEKKYPSYRRFVYEIMMKVGKEFV